MDIKRRYPVENRTTTCDSHQNSQREQISYLQNGTRRLNIDIHFFRSLNLVTILVMNLTRTSFFMVLFNFFKLPKLEGTTVKNKMLKEPCFEEDQDLTQYSTFDESFDKDGRNSFKLVHLQGKRVSR